MKASRIPALILAIWALFACLSGILPLQPNQVDLSLMFHAPSSTTWFGYDDLGRPIMDRLLSGAQTSIVVASFVLIISSIIGVSVGISSGYFGGWYDRLATRVIDVFLAFPGILLAIALAGIMGPGEKNTIIALSAMGWVGFARLSRAQTLVIKRREHIQAAVALGVGHLIILRRHLFPLILAPILVEGSFALANTVIAEAGLSFLGLGVQPPVASWGSMIRDGVRYMLVAPHIVIVPGLALSLVVMSANRLGDQLRDHFDTRTSSLISHKRT